MIASGRRLLNAGIIVIFALGCPAACGADDPLDVRDGDIIFHRSRSSQSEALALATGSQYTHMGIIFIEDSGPMVLEALNPVRSTPLSEWIDRGVSGHFVVKRLADAERILTDEAVARLRAEGRKYLGLPYDLRFEWSDDRIYCSELVWKMYRSALGIELGALETFRDFDLSDPVVEKKLRERFGDRIPMDERVISPARMFSSTVLVTVLEG